MRRAVYVDKDTQKAIVNAFLRVRSESIVGKRRCSSFKEVEENIAKMCKDKRIKSKSKSKSKNRGLSKIV